MNATKTFLNLPSKKRLKIVDAAIEEFANHTYSESNLDRIASASGVSKGSLFQYLDNKSAFYCYSVSESLDRSWEFYQDYMSRHATTDCFSTLAETILNLSYLKKKEPNLAALYLRVVYTKNSHRRDELFEKYVSRNNNIIEQLVIDGLEAGFIDPQIPAGIVRFHVHAVGSHLTYLILSGDDPRWLPRSPKRLREFVEESVGLLRRALAP